MQTTLTTDRLVAARGASVYARDGEKIGSVVEIFVDDDTGQAEWIGIGTGLLGSKRVVVPVAGAELTEDGLRVPYTREKVGETPDLEADEIDWETESRLSAHYGVGPEPAAAGDRVSLEKEVEARTERVLEDVRRERAGREDPRRS